MASPSARRTRFRSLLATFAILLASQTFSERAAEASGFLVARFGGEHGHPTTDSPTAMYYNPAGLALGKGTRIYLEGTLAYRSASYDRGEEAIDNVLTAGETGAGTPVEAIGANSGEATLGNVLVSPFVGIRTDFGVENLGVGVGLYVPFGGQAEWDRNSAFEGNTQFPGAVDGVARWFTIEGTIRSMYITAAAAYRIPTARLSFGVGFNVVLSTVDTIRARNVDGTDHLIGATGEIQEGRSLLEASGTTFSIGAGVIWQPTDTMWIGASYQSQPGFGETSLSGDLTNKFATAAPTTSPVDVEQTLPDIIRAGFRMRPTPLTEVRLFGEYVRWSVFKGQCIVNEGGPCEVNDDGTQGPGSAPINANIPRDWKDAFGVRLGGSYWLLACLETYLGVGYDSNAVPDETLEPSFIDMDKATGSAGVRWNFAPGFTLDASLLQVLYFTRETDARPRDVDGNPIPPYQQPSRVPDGAGKYKQSVTSVIVGIEYSF